MKLQIQNTDYDYSSLLNLIIDNNVALPFLRSVHASSIVPLSTVSRAWNCSIVNYALHEPQSLGQKLFLSLTDRRIENYPCNDLTQFISKYRDKALAFPVLLSLFINHEDLRVPALALREMEHVLIKKNPQGLAIIGSVLKNFGELLMDRSKAMPDRTQELGDNLKFLEDSTETRKHLTEYLNSLEANWQTKYKYLRAEWEQIKPLRNQIESNHNINDFNPVLIAGLLSEIAGPRAGGYASLNTSSNTFEFAVLLNMLSQHKSLTVRSDILDCMQVFFSTKTDLKEFQNMLPMIKPLLNNLGKSLVDSGESLANPNHFYSRSIILLITLIVMIIAIAYGRK